MEKVAILVDVGYVQKIFEVRKPSIIWEAKMVYDFSKAFLEDDEKLLRIFFYHAEPFGGKIKKKVTKTIKDFTDSKVYKNNKDFLKELSHFEYSAVRRGITSFRGWELKENVVDKIRKNSDYELQDSDYKPVIQQKGVDIKIGLDVAWISEHNRVGKIILITADSDFVPVMKFARREGVQIVVGQLSLKEKQEFKSEFKAHTDIHRIVVRNMSQKKFILMKCSKCKENIIPSDNIWLDNLESEDELECQDCKC